MGSARVVQASCATLSWIDPRAGLVEFDKGMPADTLGIDGITKQRSCRFSHLLTVSVLIEEGKITRRWVDKQTGIYARPSYKDTPVLLYPTRQDVDDWNDQRAVFVHTAGCRTQAPDVIGGAVGGALGTTIAMQPWSPVDAGTGGDLGATLGVFGARTVKSFPPVWTTLKIVIDATGNTSVDCVRHSLFPSVCFYGGNAVNQMTQGSISVWTRKGIYDGLPHYQEWLDRGFAQGNPWRVSDHQAHPITWAEEAASAAQALDLATRPYR